MTTTTALAANNLPNLSADQLGIAYGIFTRRAQVAEWGSVALTRAWAGQERVRAEAHRRDMVIRRSQVDPTTYMVGRPADFHPIDAEERGYAMNDGWVQ